MNNRYARLQPELATPADEMCQCMAGTAVLLQPHLSSNPLACGSCNGEVPPERLGFDEELANALADWRNFHDAFYSLWLDSREFEEWAAAQLEDAGSPVNARGLRLARLLSDAVGYCCYLSWFQDEGAEGWQPRENCPVCAAKLEPKFKGDPQSIRVCDTCLVAVLE